MFTQKCFAAILIMISILATVMGDATISVFTIPTAVVLFFSKKDYITR